MLWQNAGAMDLRGMHILQTNREVTKANFYSIYFAESSFYDALVGCGEQTQEFPSIFAYGDIVCSSLFPSGNVLVILGFPETQSLASG